MKLLITTFFAFFVLVINAQQWETLGSTFQFGTTDAQDMTILQNGTPVVAYAPQGIVDSVIVKEWKNNTWIDLPKVGVTFSPSQNLAELNLIHIDNIIYIGIGNNDGNSMGFGYNVFKYLAGTWVPIDEALLNSISYTTGSVKFSASTIIDDLTLSFQNFGSTADEPQVYKLIGSNWVTNFGADLTAAFSTTGSAPMVSELFHNGQDTYYYCRQTEAGQAKVNGNPELRLYKFDDVTTTWDTLMFTPTGLSYIQEMPSLISISGNPNLGQPTIAYTSPLESNDADILVQQLNGADDYIALPTFPGSFPVIALDIAVDNANEPFMAIVDNGTTNFRKVVHYNGTGWDQLTGEFLTTNTVSKVDLEIFTASNKAYVLYESDAGSGVSVYNNTATIGSSSMPTTFCQTISPSSTLTIANITINDIDNDSIYVVSATSNNQLLIQDANIIVNRTSVYNPNSQSNSFEVYITHEANVSGGLNINLNFSDGFSGPNSTQTITINSLPNVVAGTNTSICQNQNITLSGTGATSYIWNGITDGSTPTDGTPFNASLAGFYEYECIGTDGNGCINKDTLNISVNPLPTYTLGVFDIQCNGNDDGIIDFSNLNNNTNYIIEMTVDGTYNDYGTQTSNGSGYISISSLSAGSYTAITVIDPNGCQNIDNGPYVIIDPASISINPDGNYTQCEGDGDITLVGSANGGTGTLTYNFDNSITNNTPFTPVLGTTQYTLTVIDENGCSANSLFSTVIVNPLPSFSIATSNPTTCGGADGVLTLSGLVANGTYAVSYYKDNGMNQVGPNNLTANASGNIIITGLVANDYENFSVTSTSNCETIDVNVYSLSDPNAPTINPINDYTYCPQTNSSAIIFSGTAGATYNWVNDNVSINLNPNGIGNITSFTTLNASSNVETAIITVTPSMGGCTGTSTSFTITVNPLDDATFNYSSTEFCLNDANPSPSVNSVGGIMTSSVVSGGPISMSGSTGIINLGASNAGLFDITYTTNGSCPNSSTQTITLFDTPTLTATNPTICANSNSLYLDGSVSPTGGIYSGLNIQNNTFNTNGIAVGNYSYSYQYTDANGCSENATGLIVVNDVPSISFVTTNANCSGSNGTIDATISGGSGTNTITWSSGQTSEDINNLTPNNYYLTVTDNNGCYAMEVATITSTEINLAGNITNNLCSNLSNGSIDLTVTGSTGPYIYYWSNGETTEDINNLVAGQYEVFVTDQSNCTSTQSFIVNEPNALGVTIAQNNPTACGVNDGSITTTVFGGTSLYSYEWIDQTNAPIATTADLSAVSGGVYTLNITDDHGCTLTSTAVLTDNGGPVVNLVQNTGASCNNDGSIDVNVTTTNSIQSYLWNTSETTEDITNLTTGDYTLVVTDANGCEGYFSTTVNAIIPPSTNICIVTVDTATNTNLVVWEKPVTTEIDYYVIFRETSVANEFLPVDTVQYEDLSQFTDPIAYPQIRSWRYKIKSVNTCGVSSNFGDIHKTIHITINAGLGGTFNLNWDQYEGFNYSTFDIWRHTDVDGWGTIPIQSVTSNQFSISDTPPTQNGLDYMIEITPPSTCTSTIKAIDHNSSRSNRSSTVTAPPGGPNSNSIVENESLFNVTIYPNPSSGKFNVTILNEINETYNIFIYDMNGKLISNFNNNSNTLLIDLNKFKSGLYILELQTENNVVRKQLLKK